MLSLIVPVHVCSRAKTPEPVKDISKIGRTKRIFFKVSPSGKADGYSISKRPRFVDVLHSHNIHKQPFPGVGSAAIPEDIERARAKSFVEIPRTISAEPGDLS